MDDYSSFVKFKEQAFEWELMNYTFYPYYWIKFIFISIKQS
jgi:hypothetical protein